MSECKSDCFGIMPDGEPCHYHSVPSCKEQLVFADELKKEAERIIRECLEGWYDPESKFEDDGRRFYSEADEIICRALRAAHDAALEKAAKIADELFHEAGNMSVDAPQPALSLINERMRIARDLASAIRALKGSPDGADKREDTVDVIRIQSMTIPSVTLPEGKWTVTVAYFDGPWSLFAERVK